MWASVDRPYCIKFVMCVMCQNAFKVLSENDLKYVPFMKVAFFSAQLLNVYVLPQR